MQWSWCGAGWASRATIRLEVAAYCTPRTMAISGETSLLLDESIPLQHLTVVFGAEHAAMAPLYRSIRPAPPPPWLCFTLCDARGGERHFAAETDNAALGAALGVREQADRRRRELCASFFSFGSKTSGAKASNAPMSRTGGAAAAQAVPACCSNGDGPTP